jgi:predicted nucleic acid-binding protein
MIVLDTNVVSEPLKPHGNPAVRNWLDRQAPETLFITATSISELLLGVELLPAGGRKNNLASELIELLRKLFGQRILPFDQTSAIAYASIMARGRRAGCTISVGDGQVAAIANVHGFAVATRDTVPFVSMGLKVLNPWEIA